MRVVGFLLLRRPRPNLRSKARIDVPPTELCRTLVCTALSVPAGPHLIVVCKACEQFLKREPLILLSETLRLAAGSASRVEVFVEITKQFRLPSELKTTFEDPPGRSFGRIAGSGVSTNSTGGRRPYRHQQVFLLFPQLQLVDASLPAEGALRYHPKLVRREGTEKPTPSSRIRFRRRGPAVLWNGLPEPDKGELFDRRNDLVAIKVPFKD
jgi:hypothetical protein